MAVRWRAEMVQLWNRALRPPQAASGTRDDAEEIEAQPSRPYTVWWGEWDGRYPSSHRTLGNDPRGKRPRLTGGALAAAERARKAGKVYLPPGEPVPVRDLDELKEVVKTVRKARYRADDPREPKVEMIFPADLDEKDVVAYAVGEPVYPLEKQLADFLTMQAARRRRAQAKRRKP